MKFAGRLENTSGDSKWSGVRFAGLDVKGRIRTNWLLGVTIEFRVNHNTTDAKIITNSFLTCGIADFRVLNGKTFQLARNCFSR